MDVKLINCTGWGSYNPARVAAELLVFTKQTRLNMDADQMARVQAMEWHEIQTELDYMAGTIPSSWEFVDYTFLINGVSRAFTHQFVRTRTGSYAQQTMRVLDVSGWEYVTGPSIKATPDLRAEYNEAMEQIANMYDLLIEMGAEIEDARGVLPTNIKTNIVAKFNLRTLAEMAHKRASIRTQGEYRDVLDLMIEAALRVHPWAETFFRSDAANAAGELEGQIMGMDLPKDEKIRLVKLIDVMRQRA